MRRYKKEITDRDAILEILESAHVGRLGTVGSDGYPMIKPVNYVFSNNKVYIHSALEGEKIQDIKRDDRVVFEVDIPIAYVKGIKNPCSAKFLYKSVIMKGTAVICENPQERIAALTRLMEKYQPGGDYGDFLAAKLALTGVIRIDIWEITGKQDTEGSAT